MIAIDLRTTSVILGKTRASLYRVCRSTTGFHRPLPDLIDVVHRHTLVPVIPKTKQAVPPSDLLYAHLRMAKEIQLHMWTSVLQRVVALAGGRMDGGIRVVRRVDGDETSAVAAVPARRLDDLLR